MLSLLLLKMLFVKQKPNPDEIGTNKQKVELQCLSNLKKPAKMPWPL
jgi:hypothetical protein